MGYKAWHWRVKDRQLFITVLTETGNPAVMQATGAQVARAVRAALLKADA